MVFTAFAVSAVTAAVPGLGPLITVLESIHSVCQDLKDCKASVQFTHGRLTVILEELKTMEAKNTIPPSGAVDKFHRTLTVLWADLAPYQDISLVARVLRHSRLKETIETVNVEIDGLFQMLAIATTSEMMEWKNQWKLDAEAHNEEMRKLMESHYLLLESVKGVKAQMDAMVLLKAELDKMEKNESEQPQEVQDFVEESFRAVSRLSDGIIPVLPQWFIAESSVTYTPEYFARGSFGSVHHGKYLGTDVVVKLLLPGENGIELSIMDGENGFLPEANLWYTFDYPHVVEMLGACHISNRPFIVSKFAKNGNVADWLRKPASRFQMWKCMYEAALGLNYLHSKQVIHGDLKLNNLLVGADYDVRVADFGLSRVKTTSRSKVSKLASGTEVEGGLHWLAPERFTTKPHYNSDVYALAMCIIEAALGDAPYGRLDSVSVRAKIKNGELPPKPEKLSDDGWALVQKMTVKDPFARIKLEDAIEELRRLADHESMTLSRTAPYCTACRKPQRLEAKWCDQCRLSLHDEEPSVEVAASRSVADLVKDLKSQSPQVKNRAPRLVYQAIAADATARDAVKSYSSKLLSLAQETDRFSQAVYAFGCLEAIGTASDAEMATIRENLSGVVSQNVTSLLALLNAQDQNERDERQAAELVVLIVGLLPAKRAQNQGALCGLVRPLATALTHKTIEVRGAVVLALDELTRNHETNLHQLIEERVTAPLFDVLASQSPTLQQSALRLLFQVASNSPSTARECGEKKRIRQLVELLDGEEKETVVDLITRLANVSHDLRVRLGRGELVHELVDLLLDEETTPVLKSKVFKALAALVQVPSNATKFVEAGGVAGLKALLVSETSEEVLLAVSRFVENDTIRAAVVADTDMLKACLDAFAAKDVTVESNATRLLGELVHGNVSVVTEMRRVKGLMLKLAKRNDDAAVRAILAVIDELAAVVADSDMLKACLDAFAAKDGKVETNATRLLGELVHGNVSVVTEMRRVDDLMSKLAKRNDTAEGTEGVTKTVNAVFHEAPPSGQLVAPTAPRVSSLMVETEVAAPNTIILNACEAALTTDSAEERSRLALLRQEQQDNEIPVSSRETKPRVNITDDPSDSEFPDTALLHEPSSATSPDLGPAHHPPSVRSLTMRQRAAVTEPVVSPARSAWELTSSRLSLDPVGFAHGSSATFYRGRLDEQKPVVVLQAVFSEDIDRVSLQRVAADEADAWMALKHPFVIELFAASIDCVWPFFVAEEAGFGRLVEYCVHHRLSPRRRLQLLLEAAIALEYLHSKKVVHGNIELLVGSDGSARVGGFGFTRVLTLSGMKSKLSTQALSGEVTDLPSLASDVRDFGFDIFLALTGQPLPTEAGDAKTALESIEKGDGSHDHDVLEMVSRMTASGHEEHASMKDVVATLVGAVGRAKENDVTRCKKCGEPVLLVSDCCENCELLSPAPFSVTRPNEHTTGRAVKISNGKQSTTTQTYDNPVNGHSGDPGDGDDSSSAEEDSDEPADGDDSRSSKGDGDKPANEDDTRSSEGDSDESADGDDSRSSEGDIDEPANEDDTRSSEGDSDESADGDDSRSSEGDIDEPANEDDARALEEDGDKPADCGRSIDVVTDADTKIVNVRSELSTALGNVGVVIDSIESPDGRDIASTQNAQALAQSAAVQSPQCKFAPLTHPHAQASDGIESSYNEEESRTTTALFQAIEQDNLQEIERLLKRNPRAVNAQDRAGFSPLMSAAVMGRASVVKFLIRQNAVVDSTDNIGNTALSRAAARGDAEITKLLLAAKADVRWANKDGITVLEMTVAAGQKHIVELLLTTKQDGLTFGPDVNASTNDETKPLLTAIRRGDEDIVQKLVEAKADVNYRSRSGKTPLLEAIKVKNQNIVRILLANGATATLETDHSLLRVAVKETPTLDVAYGIVRRLCAAGAMWKHERDASSRDGFTTQLRTKKAQGPASHQSGSLKWRLGLIACAIAWGAAVMKRPNEDLVQVPFPIIEEGEDKVNWFFVEASAARAHGIVWVRHVNVIGSAGAEVVQSLKNLSSERVEVVVSAATDQAVNSLQFQRNTLSLICVDPSAFVSCPKGSEDQFLMEHVFDKIVAVLARQPQADLVLVAKSMDFETDTSGKLWLDLKGSVAQLRYDIEHDKPTAISARWHLQQKEVSPDLKPQAKASLTRLLENGMLVVSSRTVQEQLKVLLSKSSPGLALLPRHIEARSRIRDLHRPLDDIQAVIQRLGRLLETLFPGASWDQSSLETLEMLGDVGEIVWGEDDGRDTLVFISPTLPMDVFRIIEKAAREGKGKAVEELKRTGMLSHDFLKTLNAWKSMDDEMLRQCKQFLVDWQLASPLLEIEGGIKANSDLIVPGCKTVSNRPKFSRFRSQFSKKFTFDKDTIVEWEYQIATSVATEIFDHLQAACHSPYLQEASASRIFVGKSGEDAFTAQITHIETVDPASRSKDTIRIEVAASTSTRAWDRARVFISKMEKLIARVPRLSVSRWIVEKGKNKSSECRHDVDAEVAREKMAADGETEYLRPKFMPTDFEWYTEKCWMNPSAFRRIQDNARIMQEMRVLRRLDMTPQWVRDFPLLWTCKRIGETGLELRMLSDLSGDCHHTPHTVPMTPEFLANHGDKLQVVMRTFANVIPDFFLGKVVDQGVGYVEEWLGERIERSKVVHDLLKQVGGLPVDGEFNSSTAGGLDPHSSANLLEDVLRLVDADYRRKVSILSGLYPATTKDGLHVWGSREEIRDRSTGPNALTLGYPLTITSPQASLPQSSALLPPPSSSASASSAVVNVPRVFKVAVKIEYPVGLTPKEERRMFCEWELWNESGKLMTHTILNPHPANRDACFVELPMAMTLDELNKCLLKVSVNRRKWRVWKRPVGVGSVQLRDKNPQPGAQAFTLVLSHQLSRTVTTSLRLE